MARQLVVCLDGTGNRFDHHPTHIVRLAGCLVDDPAQVLVYYDQGLGTFGLRETLFQWQKVPSRLLGVAFGWGLQPLVAGAYAFLAQHWQPGDRIFVFGFSRGAYAARALAALLHSAGLLPGHQLNLFDDAWALLKARPGKGKQPDFALQARFKKAFSRRVQVDFLGLFDTVKSIGWLYDPLVLPYTANNPIVRTVRHALSIDERRAFFRPNHWGNAGPRQCVKEVWFAGVHADVGGGYPPAESQLALCALRWMLGEAAAAGMALDSARVQRQLAPAPGVRASPEGRLHVSLQGLWWLAEWLPQVYWNTELKRRCVRLGSMPPFGQPRPRAIAAGAWVHHSAMQRLHYQPVNWPQGARPAEDLPLRPAAGGTPPSL